MSDKTAQPIRWGILGCGSIARSLATAIVSSPGSELAAVGSRQLSKAREFAGAFGGASAFGSYEELASCDCVDVVYVATPHPMHAENALLCLHHGKHVLGEKPFAISAAQARDMIESARSSKRFLMEAMWTRFFPVTRQVRQWVAEGVIGALRMVTVDFGFRAGFDPKSRLFDPQLGGGALLDVGVYGVSYASMLLGRPSEVAALMKPAPTGVDAQTGVLLGYPDGAMAVVSTTLEATTPWEAVLLGEKGSIRVHSAFWKPTSATLERGKGPERFERPFEGNGYQFQVQEVEACLAAGHLESPIMPLDESLSVMETLDWIREKIGLSYPQENQ